VYRETGGSKEELDIAIAEYKKAIENKPDFGDAYFGLGLAYYRKGLKKEAKEAFENYLRLNPDAEERGEIERQFNQQ